MDVEAARRFALEVWRIKQGEVVAFTIHLGVRLGLYEAMAGAGPLTVEEVAAAADVDERWTREWLRAQAAAGLLEHDEGRFTLTNAGAAVLADDRHSPLYAGGVFHAGLGEDLADAVAESFSTGAGFDYDAGGPAMAGLIQEMNEPWARLLLVPMVLPAFEGLVAALGSGRDVVDVGCGTGGALLAMASSFPASRFTGVDPSTVAIARAEERTDELDNVTLVEGTTADLEQDSADLVTAFDCLHDMARPDRALVDLRRVVRSDGLVIVKDVKTAADFEQQQRNPVLAMMYGLSMMACLPSGIGDGDGLALGNQGLTPQKVHELATAAGFAHVAVHDLDDPVNLYYELRP